MTSKEYIVTQSAKPKNIFETSEKYTTPQSLSRLLTDKARRAFYIYNNDICDMMSNIEATFYINSRRFSTRVYEPLIPVSAIENETPQDYQNQNDNFCGTTLDVVTDRDIQIKPLPI